MADAWGWLRDGEIISAYVQRGSVESLADRSSGRAVALKIETAPVRYAGDLHQVLRDLTGLAKMASAPMNTYQAAVRNAVELLKQIERESMEDNCHG